MYLIVGLGNPGEKFAHTRHNLGFKAVEEFARRSGHGEWSLENKFKAEIIRIDYHLPPTTSHLILAKPLTFMNRSGMAVSKIASYFKLKPKEIIVIHDELDLILGHIKVKIGGSGAGHHGVESIINGLGTDKFIRVRMGIGNEVSLSGEHKHRAFNAEHFVVESFTSREKSKTHAMIKRAVKAVETILQEGIDKAQNQFN